jgi:hypothetical protein
MKQQTVTIENAWVGMKVIKGPSWSSHDLILSKGEIGVIKNIDTEYSIVYVDWPCGENTPHWVPNQEDDDEDESELCIYQEAPVAYRFKTEAEFFAEYGPKWDDLVRDGWARPKMDRFFGQFAPDKLVVELKQTHSVEYFKWSVNMMMLTPVTEPHPAPAYDPEKPLTPEARALLEEFNQTLIGLIPELKGIL